MRPFPLVPILACVFLAACGKSGGSGSGAAAGPTPQEKALLASLPAQYQTADLENGRLHFGLCHSCHTIAQGAPDMVGPNLYGVFGRKAGSKPGYPYSDALRQAGFVWDAQHLDRWIAGPRDYLPGTKMTFLGIKDPKDRTDLIAYLKVASSGGPQ